MADHEPRSVIADRFGRHAPLAAPPSVGALGLHAAAWRISGACIVAVALVLRVICAIVLPYDQDELYTVLEARDLFATKLLPGIDARPLFYLLEHPLLAVLPRTPMMLRLLPVIFGVAGVWATWRLARRWFGEPAGVATALLIAVSPWHMYASTTARYYSLVYLCTVWALWALTEAYDLESPRYYLLALAAFVIGTLTHPSFVIGTAGAVIGLSLVASSGEFAWRWPSRKAWGYLWLPYLAFLLLGVVALKLVGRSSAMGNVATRGSGASVRLVPAMIDWMTVSVFAAAVLGSLTLAWRRSPQRRVGVMTLASLTFAFTLLFAVSLRTGVYADYGVGVLVLVFVACGAVVTGVPREAQHQYWWPAVVLLLILAGGAPSVISYFSDGMRFDYRPAYASIARDPSNLAVIGWPAIVQDQYAPKMRRYELRPDVAYLDRILESEHEVWAVVSVKRYGIASDLGSVTAGWLAHHCRIVAAYERPRFDFRMYRVELHRCGLAQASPAPVR